MRIDVLVSVLSKGINDLECAIEEENLRQAIGKLLYEQGYTKFTVVGSDIINDNVKSKVVLD
jgi:hypothetical protein